jgi:hypothetical protein
MSKAVRTPTTAPAAPAPAIPPPGPDGAWLRMLAPSFETDELWASRDPVSRIMFAVTGAADQIGGLAEICWSLNFSDMRQGGQWTGERGLRHPYGFIAKTLSDVARGLREAHKIYSAEANRLDEEPSRASRRAGK